jgi:AcrR family transcriptional regulator
MTRPRTVADQAILEAVRACASEHGAAVSLDVIARRVGLSPPALLKRFGSRQKLMITALRPSEEPAWVRELANGPDQRPLETQLHGLIEQVLEAISTEVPCMTALLDSKFPAAEIFDQATAPTPLRQIWALSGWLERAAQRRMIDPEAVSGGDFEGVATSLLGALHGRVFLSDFVGPAFWRRSRPQYVSDLARLYRRALAPAGERPQRTLRKSAAASQPSKRKKS